MSQFLNYFINRLRSLRENFNFPGKMSHPKCSAPKFLVTVWVPKNEKKKKDDAVLKVKARCQKISQAVFGLKKKKKREE